MQEDSVTIWGGDDGTLDQDGGNRDGHEWVHWRLNLTRLCGGWRRARCQGWCCGSNTPSVCDGWWWQEKSGRGLASAEEDAELVLNILMHRDTGRNINQAVGTLGPECRGNVWACLGRVNRKTAGRGFSWTPAACIIYMWCSSAVCFCYICLTQSCLSAYFPYLSHWWATSVCILRCCFICCCA